MSALHKKTDGWVAGLVAIMNSAGSIRAEGSRLGHEELLFDYFAHEVFDRSTPAQQLVLLRTSLFRRFTAAMAAAVTGDSAVQEFMESLYRRQCFVERRSEHYQYHDLFRQFLLSRLPSMGTSQLQASRTRAAEVLVQQFDFDDAIELSLDSSDLESAARLIRLQAASMVEQGRHAQLGAWLAKLPERALDADPWLRCWQGVGLLLANPAGAVDVMIRAYRGFETTDDLEGVLRAIEGTIQAYLASWSSATYLDEWIDTLARHLPLMTEALSESVQLQAWNVFLPAAMDRQPGHPLIERGIHWMIDHLQSPSISDSLRLEACGQILGYSLLGVHPELRTLIEPIAVPLAASEDTAPLSRLIWARSHGSILGHCTELEASISVLASAIELAERLNAKGWSYGLYTMRAYAYWWQNEQSLAAEGFDKMCDIGARAGFPKTVFEHKGRALIAAQRGQIEEAIGLAELTIEAADARGPAYMRSFARADMAPIAIQAGQLDKAERWITEGEAIDATTIVRINSAQYQAVRATLAFQRHDRPGGLRHL